MLDLEKRTAVITGAGSGIGRALAEKAASRGMSLALADIDRAALDAVCDAVAPRTDVLAEIVDVRDRAALEAFAARVTQRYRSLALVFANAGVMRAGTSWELTAADWDRVLDINVKGVVHTASAFIPHLLDQPLASRIVITGSTSGFLSRPHLTAYSASKHALWGIAEAMQQELAEHNPAVAVSLLAPAGVKTRIAAMPDGAAENLRQNEIHGLLDQFGMSATDLAEQVFAAVREQRFWIVPHPEFKSELALRTERVVQERDPRDAD